MQFSIKQPVVVLLLVTVSSISLVGSHVAPSFSEIAPARPQLTPASISVTDDGWIEYQPSLAPRAAPSRTVLVVGRRDPARGCSMRTPATDPAKVAVVEEVAFNPRLCRYRVRITQWDAPLHSVAGPARRATRYARFLKTSWIDPVNITITSQAVALRWTRTTLLDAGTRRHSFKGCIAGRCLDNTYIVNGLTGPRFITNGWRRFANVHFRNRSFAKWVAAAIGPAGWAACGFPRNFTADFYHVDVVTGLKKGTSTTSSNDSKSGACTNLVHHGSKTGPTYF